MNQDKPKQEVKTLSIRIPEKLYLTVSQYVLDNNMSSMNSAIIALISDGLTARQNKDKVISQFIIELVSKERLEEIINGPD